MKEKILGFPQARALELSLDVVDIMLYDIVAHSHNNENMSKIKRNGKMFTRIKYDAILDYLPILRIQKRALGNRLAKLCKVGLLEKYTSKGELLATYFRVAEDALQMTNQCHQNDAQFTNRNTNLTEKKEKDNKLSKKKKDELGFEVAFDEFKRKASEDAELAYSLDAYNITDLEALLEAFRKYLTETLKIGEFVGCKYMRRRQWLVRALTCLDLTEATGVKLGKGEYIKDGKRYYIHPRGVEKEVPLDAPPRQLTSQVWYVEEKRWGPQL